MKEELLAITKEVSEIKEALQESNKWQIEHGKHDDQRFADNENNNRERFEKTQEGIDELRELVGKLVDKVDEHIEQHTKDMEELKPFIQARGTLTFMFKSLLAAGAAAAAWLSIKGLYTK